MSKKTYAMCGETEYKLIRSVIEKHHPTLNEGHVSFSLMFVYAAKDEDNVPKGAAITERGKPADYTVKVTPVEMRVRGMADVMVSIDGDRWDDKSEDEQTAIFDRLCESMFVEIGKDEARTVKSDAADRPVISRREPDLVVVGYSAVMKRNGRFSPEQEVIAEFTSAMKQADLPLPGVDASAAPKALKLEAGKRKRGAAKAKGATRVVEIINPPPPSAWTAESDEATVDDADARQVADDITAIAKAMHADDENMPGDYDAPEESASNVAPLRRSPTRALLDRVPTGAPS